MSKGAHNGARFGQVAVLLVEGLGIGAGTADAQGSDRAADTLGHVAAYVGGLEVPFLQWLGLGNAHAVRGLERTVPPAASVATVTRRSEGADPVDGVREIFGPVLANLVDAGLTVTAIGGVAGFLDDGEVTSAELVEGVAAALAHMEAMVARHEPGVVVASLASPAPASGPVAVARRLARLDAELPALLDCLDEDSLLLLIGVSGADPTVAVGDAVWSAERTALLAYTPAIPSGVDLGARASLADIGATLAENFGVEGPTGGQSFFQPLIS